jgi:hypothetical protein
MMLTPQQKEAAEVLLYREKVQKNFVEMIRACGFNPAPHQVIIAEHLQQMAEGKIDRLIVNAPPGSSKSTLISQLFPAWCMAFHKGCSFLGVSHTYELAERNGRRVRNLIKDKALVLDNDLQGDTAAAFRFATTNGSEFHAAGVGQAIQGFRATCGQGDRSLRQSPAGSALSTVARRTPSVKSDARTYRLHETGSCQTTTRPSGFNRVSRSACNHSI